MKNFGALLFAALLLAGCNQMPQWGSFPTVINNKDPIPVRIVDDAPAQGSSVVAEEIPDPLPSGYIKPGDGHAYVWAGQRKARTKQQIAAAIRKDDRSILRVPANVIMGQVAARLGLGAFESVSAFADWLESDQVEMVKCSPNILSTYYLSRVDGGRPGSSTHIGTQTFDHKWSREKCDPNEYFLTWQGKHFLSNTCINLMSERVPFKLRPQVPRKQVSGGKCIEAPVYVVQKGNRQNWYKPETVEVFVWGGNHDLADMCGLVEKQCHNCSRPEFGGKATKAYVAHSQNGKIYLPQAMMSYGTKLEVCSTTPSGQRANWKYNADELQEQMIRRGGFYNGQTLNLYH